MYFHEVSALHAVAILLAGVIAGMINTVVGSGTLFTFPVLLAFGYAPVVANVSNTVGLVPGSLAGALGYRRELAGQRRRALPLAAASVVGALAGAVLLLTLPGSAFRAIVPAFIAVAVLLILAQPAIARGLARKHASTGRGRGAMLGAVGASGVYGGYFGAAQGILLLAILGLGIDDELQRVNALKVVLAGLVNLVAGVVFVLVGDVDWGAAALIALGSSIGGAVGASAGRRLRPAWLRALVVTVGTVAVVRLLA